MMRALFAGISGLRVHQLRMDVIGNNIANVNTPGFKAARATFRQLLGQTLRGASRPTQDRGGTNPIQVGLGVALAGVETSLAQGGLQSTGKVTHMAVEGNGFFVLRDGQGLVYTRAGAFDVDGEGYLVDPSGLRVQGWIASGGVLPERTVGNLRDIRLRPGEPIAARATTRVAFGHNLDSRAADGGSVQVVVDLFDSLGNLQPVTFTFTRNDNGATPETEWDWVATWDGATVGSGTIAFDAIGAVATGGTGTVAFTPPGAAPLSVAVDFTAVTQFAAASSVTWTDRDGYPSGTLETFDIDDRGVITGIYSNGISQAVAQVALARFANPGGLTSRGGGLFVESNNSGDRTVGPAGGAGFGSVAPGTLEMSNVDLAQEFTDMIVTQRGFQASARIITSTDELLQELVNLKR